MTQKQTKDEARRQELASAHQEARQRWQQLRDTLSPEAASALYHYCEAQARCLMLANPARSPSDISLAAYLPVEQHRSLQDCALFKMADGGSRKVEQFAPAIEQAPGTAQ